MTELLQQVIDRASQLPQTEQDAVAIRFLEELEEFAEARHWANLFANSEIPLERLAADALEEHLQGKTRPLQELLDEAL